MDGTKHGFTLWKKKGVRFFTIPSFERAGGVTCVMSTRVGGVSPKPYDTLNFSRSREQNEDNFRENFRRYADAAGFDYTKAIANNYEHGSVVLKAERKDAGRGVIKENLDTFCDGLYTTEENLPLVTFHADCVPLFFYDPKCRVIAICHAGWKGISMHIIKTAVSALVDTGCRQQDILAAVGPCISVKYFEVKNDVSGVFGQTFGAGVIEHRNGRIYVDLPKACVTDMLDCGLLAGNITLSDLCTYEHKRLFFSHRRDRGQTGAMAAAICINRTE